MGIGSRRVDGPGCLLIEVCAFVTPPRHWLPPAVVPSSWPQAVPVVLAIPPDRAADRG